MRKQKSQDSRSPSGEQASLMLKDDNEARRRKKGPVDWPRWRCVATPVASCCGPCPCTSPGAAQSATPPCCAGSWDRRTRPASCCCSPPPPTTALPTPARRPSSRRRRPSTTASSRPRRNRTASHLHKNPKLKIMFIILIDKTTIMAIFTNHSNKC